MSIAEAVADPKRSLDKVPNAPERREPEGFILRLAKALHTFGLPSYELEKLIQGCGSALGFGVQCMSLPTSISMTFLHPNGVANSYIIRVDPGVINLEKLRSVTDIAQQVIDRSLSPREGADELYVITESPERYSWFVNVIALWAVSFGLARVFSGGMIEMAVSGFLGVLVGLTMLATEKIDKLKPLLPTVCSLLVVLSAQLIDTYLLPFSLYVVIVSSLIILLPGLNLTIAITELATENLVSGTARLMGAAIVFLQLGLGLAIGGQLSQQFFLPSTIAALEPLPMWTLWPSLMLASAGLVIPFNARYKDALWFIIAGLIAFGSSLLFSHYLGKSIGAFFAAICVGLSANIVKRFFNLPGSIILLPGFLILVPGSIGFKSISAIVENDLVVALEIGVSTLMTGLSLVMGLLLSSLTTFNFSAKKSS